MHTLGRCCTFQAYFLEYILLILFVGLELDFQDKRMICYKLVIVYEANELCHQRSSLEINLKMCWRACFSVIIEGFFFLRPCSVCWRSNRAEMILGGPGCRLQTCSRLAPEQFDSAFSAFIGCGNEPGETLNSVLRLALRDYAWSAWLFRSQCACFSTSIQKLVLSCYTHFIVMAHQDFP